MDKLSELTHGAKIVLGAAIVLLIVSFLNWFEIGDVGVGTMWNGIGILAGLLLIALIVWQAIRIANIQFEIGIGPAMVTAALAVLLLIFTFIRFISTPGGSLGSAVGVDRTLWAWIGLILAIVIVVGAWLNMQASGESVQAMMDRFGSKDTAAAPPAPAPPPPPAPMDQPPPAASPAPPEESTGTERPE